MPTKRFTVRGKVQGVFYRVAAKRMALEYGVTGHARNMPDGSVEVLACGTKHAIGDLEAWIWEGSPQARVEAVEIEELELDDEPEEFTVG